MIELRSPLEIEADSQGRLRLVLWAGNAFDYATPFRDILAAIAAALGRHRRCDLHLPEYEDGEDFVEGTLKFGNEVLRIYYEHSLSYLTITGDDETGLRDVADCIQSMIKET